MTYFFTNSELKSFLICMTTKKPAAPYYRSSYYVIHHEKGIFKDVLLSQDPRNLSVTVKLLPCVCFENNVFSWRLTKRKQKEMKTCTDVPACMWYCSDRKGTKLYHYLSFSTYLLSRYDSVIVSEFGVTSI